MLVCSAIPEEMKFLVIEENNFDQFKIQFYLEQIGYTDIFFVENVCNANLKIEALKPNIIIASLCVNNENVLPLFEKRLIQKTPTLFFTEKNYGCFINNIKLLKNFILLPKPINKACFELAIYNLAKKAKKDAALADTFEKKFQ